MKKKPKLLSLTLCVSLGLHGCLFFISPVSRPRYTAPPGSAPFKAFSLVNLMAIEPAAPEKPPPPAEPPPRQAPLQEPSAIAVPETAPEAAAEPAETFVTLETPPENPSPEPAPLPPPPSPAQAYLRDNYASIQRRIREKLAYPPEAFRSGIQGVAELSFVIHTDGSVSEVRITRSSGSETLDASAVEAIYSAAPFRPPPSQARLVMPVAFRIR
jgi:protein TonB